MRKTNKLLALALCAGLSLSMLGGCGKDDSDSKKEKTKTEETKTEATAEPAEEVEPVIENAASYLELTDYKPLKLKKSEIDAQVQDAIDQALDTYASYKEIKKGTVEDGDTVNIHYIGRLNGEAFDGGSYTKEDYPSGYNLTIGSKQFIDGFEDALIGKTIGKTYDIDVTFPEDYKESTLAGQPTVFTVTINYKRGEKIKEKFTDKFVKTNLTQYKSVKDFKKQNRESIIRNMALQKVCNDTEIKEYPEDRVEDMTNQLKTSIESYLTQNNMTLDSYLESQNMTNDDYEEQSESTARIDVGNQLVYQAIAQAENLEVTDEEYQTELNTYLTNYGASSEAELNSTFQTYYGTTAKNIIYNNLLYNKVGDYLVANVEEV